MCFPEPPLNLSNIVKNNVKVTELKQYSGSRLLCHHVCVWPAAWFFLACLPSTWQIYAGIMYKHVLACGCVLYRCVNILGSRPILSVLWRRWGHTCAIAMLNVLACATVQSRVKSTRLAWHTNFAHFVCTSNAKHTSWSPRRVDIRNTGSKQYRPSQERGTTRTM